MNEPAREKIPFPNNHPRKPVLLLLAVLITIVAGGILLLDWLR